MKSYLGTVVSVLGVLTILPEKRLQILQYKVSLARGDFPESSLKNTVRYENINLGVNDYRIKARFTDCNV